MKKFTLIILLFISTIAFSQNEMSTKTGSVNFEASVPLFEEVKATNKTAFCVLNTKTGAITSTVLIKDFRFKIPMMEEHFNDKYMKSADYPKATFKGVIEGFNIADFAWGTANAATVTLSFWVKASIAGTYSAFAINSSEDRSYVATFTVSATNTWEY